MHRINQALVECYPAHVSLRFFKELGIRSNHLVDSTRHQTSGRLDVGGVLPPDVFHPETISRKRFFRGFGAHKNFWSTLVVTRAVYMHRHAQLFERAAPVKAGSGKPLEHHAAHRVNKDLVGMRGNRILNLAVACRPNGDFLAGSLHAIHCCADLAKRSQARFLQILHTEMHRRNAFVFGSKRQSPRHVAQTREGVRAVNHGRKCSLAVKVILFHNLPRQSHQ